MGLDMYLKGNKFYWSPRKKEDGFDVSDKTLELAYWRKHPNLHGFIVDTVAKGVDECQNIELSLTDLKNILQAVIDDTLPMTTGFFFGASLPEDKEPTIAYLTAAIAWASTEVKGESRSVVYRASW